MAHLKVNIVAADKEVWTGKATQVTVRTSDGDLGIMADHTPLLAALTAGEVRVTTTDGESITADADGGFVSVEHNTVAIVAGTLTLTSAA